MNNTVLVYEKRILAFKATLEIIVLVLNVYGFSRHLIRKIAVKVENTLFK